MKKVFVCAVLAVIFGVVGSNVTANATEVFSNYKETVTIGTDEKFTVDYSADQIAECTENQFEEEEVIISCEPKKYTCILNKDTFKYKIHIPDDGHLEYVRDEENENDQAVLIYDSNQLLVGYIENIIPANNNISVELSLEDNVVTQHYTYPRIKNFAISDEDMAVGINIVATQAEKFSTYFTEGKWITRSGQVSLSLYLRIILESVAQRNAAWSTVNFVFNGSANWKNTTGMKDQFMCHSYFAKSKNPWNLEPWRPNVGYAQTVAKGCNP